MSKKLFDPFQIYKFTFDDEGYFQSCAVPKVVETCVCCGKRLFVQCSGWDAELDSNLWYPVEIDLECERGMKCYKEYENSEYWRMPYVYWLPVEEHIKRWLTRMLEIYWGIRPIPKKWLERNGQLKIPFEGIGTAEVTQGQG